MLIGTRPILPRARPAMGHRADLPTAKSGDEVKLIIEGNGVRVKLEANFVFRGNRAGTEAAHLHRARHHLGLDLDTPEY